MDQIIPEEVSTKRTNIEKKGNAEKNMQNLKKPNPNQNFKTKDIKDKIVKQIIPKEKGEGVRKSK